MLQQQHALGRLRHAASVAARAQRSRHVAQDRRSAVVVPVVHGVLEHEGVRPARQRGGAAVRRAALRHAQRAQRRVRHDVRQVEQDAAQRRAGAVAAALWC
jgi:hypothetical protein